MIKLLETDEDKIVILPFLEKITIYEYEEIAPSRKETILKKIINWCNAPSAEVYGYFDVYENLIGFIIFNIWWNYEEKIYSMGLCLLKEDLIYDTTYDGKTPNIKIDLINYAVDSFEKRGYNTMYYMSIDNDKIYLPHNNIFCLLNKYNCEFVKYIEIGEHYPKGLEPTGGGLLLKWKRENPLSYLVEWPLPFRQKIFKMTKVQE